MWDDEVDVICLGGVVGALASAVVAVDADVEVFVATSAAQDGAWLDGDIVDAETLEYFASLTAELEWVTPTADAEVPVRAVAELPVPERRGRKVAPFFGGRLKHWAEQCLSSPYALLHTRVSDWGTTGMRTLDGKPVQVKTLGTLSLATEAGAPSLVGWLFDAADARDIHIRSDTTLQRLVFEDGFVIGAVLNTADGPYAVAARHGVTLAPAVTVAESTVAAGVDDAEVALVSHAGSRFARLEVLVPAVIPPAANVQCVPSNRRLTATLKDHRRGRSESRRWRKVDRYPPFGQ